MNRTIFAIVCTLVVVLGWPAATMAADGRRDLASAVLGIFSAKCAGCHGPNLAKPKGRFGYILDLGRVAGNPELVVPSSPDESELWEHVRRDEMPPDDAPTGPLSMEEKDLIRAWIAAGAPNVAPEQATEAPLPEPDHPDDVLETSAPSFINHTVGRLGPFHVVAVHFPIALLIAAAVAELWAFCHGFRMPAPAVRFCVRFGAAGALAAAALGWLHASNGHGASMSQTLGLHRWIGSAAALWSIGTVLLSQWDEQRGVRSPWFRAWLLIGALLVAVAGHLGGILVHGEGFFSHR
jgi:uncharacterized membrane protein/mono/diheme cytochrome c family protein